MPLSQLQKQIENAQCREIRLEKTNRKRNESLQEFLIKFFTGWNAVRATIYVDNKEVQTEAGKRRSLGDIFMICQYYYPKLKLEELLYELYIRLPKYFSKGFRTSYCNLIHKRVWYYDENRANLFYDKTKHDEYANPYRYYLAFFTDEISDDDEEEELCDNCEEPLDDCTCNNDYADDYDDSYDCDECNG